MKLMLFAVALLISGCSSIISDSKPTPFITGEDTTPPYGCIEYRARGGDC